MKKIKALMAEFKAFITRGNVVDMAVAVIIGAAFSAIVTSMTNGIIKPLVDWAVGGGEAIGLKTMLKTVYEVDEAGAYIMVDGAKVINWANSIYIDWGDFIMKVIDFLLIALVLFAIIKVFMTIKNVASKAGEQAKKQTKKLAKKLQKQGMSEEEALKQAEAQAAEQAAAAEPVAPVAPSTEELLIQIRDLLAAQQNGGVEKESEEKPE